MLIYIYIFNGYYIIIIIIIIIIKFINNNQLLERFPDRPDVVELLDTFTKLHLNENDGIIKILVYIY